jgi:hypothetical protein
MATKKKKYPKSPKTTSSLQVWEKYKERCKEVDKFNSSIITDKAKKAKLITEVQKLKSKVK